MQSSMISGFYIIYEGNYSASTTYDLNATVTHDEAVWITTTTSVDTEPELDNDDWYIIRQDIAVDAPADVNLTYEGTNSSVSNTISTMTGVTSFIGTSNITTVPENSDTAFILIGMTTEDVAALATTNLLYNGFVEITGSTEYNVGDGLYLDTSTKAINIRADADRVEGERFVGFITSKTTNSDSTFTYSALFTIHSNQEAADDVGGGGGGGIADGILYGSVEHWGYIGTPDQIDTYGRTNDTSRDVNGTSVTNIADDIASLDMVPAIEVVYNNSLWRMDFNTWSRTIGYYYTNSFLATNNTITYYIHSIVRNVLDIEVYVSNTADGTYTLLRQITNLTNFGYILCESSTSGTFSIAQLESNFSDLLDNGNNGYAENHCLPAYTPTFLTFPNLSAGQYIKVIFKFNETSSGLENYDGTISSYCDVKGNADSTTNGFKSGSVRVTEIQVPAAHHLTAVL